MRSIQLAALFSALLFGARNVAALGLGDLTVHSRLGQTLRAEIRLLETPGAQAGEACFSLGAADGNEDLPVLSHARLRLEQVKGQNRLVITSLSTINEPALMINVRAGCGTELVRSYTVLVDPAEAASPEAAENTVGSGLTDDSAKAPPSLPTKARAPDSYPDNWEIVEGESGESITRALFPRQPRAQGRFLKALRAANPLVDFGEKGEKLLESGVSLIIPDTRRAPVAQKATDELAENRAPAKSKKPAEIPRPSPDGKMSDRLMISGDAAVSGDPGGTGDAGNPLNLDLRLSADLSVRLSDKVSENARAMLRVEYKLLNALVFQAQQQLDLAEQVRNLEARFEEMRAANEGAMKVADEALAARKASQPAVEEVAEKKPVVRTAPLKSPVSPAERPRDEGSAWWQFVLLMLIPAGGLAWWLVRRQRTGKVLAVRPEESIDSDDSAAVRSLPQNDVPTEIDPWEAAEADTVASVRAPGAKPDILLDDSKPLDFDGAPGTKNAPPAPAIEVSQVNETDDSNTVLELAEIMISFGRIKGAAQALAEYLENNPAATLLPWLKLLEIYRMNDMPAEFAECALRLKSHFNVAPASWEAAGECLGERMLPLGEDDPLVEEVLRKLPAVGAFPHVSGRIAETWDTSEGLPYLRHLLRDTRDGQRGGFPLSMARELLFLIDLQESRRNRA